MSRPVFDRKSLLRHFSRVPLAAVLIAMPLAVIHDAVSSSVSSQSRLSILGADVSTLQRGMELGARYYNASGAQQHALDILKGVGVNYIRLRVWVNPASGYNNKNRVVAFAPQVKSRGLKLLIDLHYSDYWADPGRKDTPAAWRNHSLSQLQTDVYNHTLDVCNSLKTAGATPDMIQVGNEINQGLLWPAGRISNNNFANAAALLKAGYSAVKACSSSTQVALHIAAGGDNGTSRWWFDGMQRQGVQWDVTAESYYCFWHGSLSAMQSNVANLRSRMASRSSSPKLPIRLRLPMPIVRETSLPVRLPAVIRRHGPARRTPLPRF